MLVYIKIKNFLSFDRNDGLFFDMVTKNCRGKSNHYIKSNKLNLLRFSSIYGANAAGKSNIVSAFEFIKDTIINNQDNQYWSKYHSLYNRVDEKNIHNPTFAEISIKLGTKIYRYGFEVILSKSILTKEWLYQNDSLMFLRDIEKAHYELNFDHFKTQTTKNIVNALFTVSQSENKMFFLNEMNRAKSSLYENSADKNLYAYKKLFNWIRESLVIVRPDRPVHFISDALTPEGNSERIISILKKCGFDIEKLNFICVSPESVFSELDIPDDLKKDFLDDVSQKLLENDNEFNEIAINGPTGIHFFSKEDDKVIAKRLSVVHENQTSFKMSEESDGTKRVLELIEILLEQNKNITYIVDEIDRSLHPLLTKAFVELFINEETLGDTQLLVTTHASILLDQKLLRKDSLNFATKQDGNTKLKNLANFEVRPEVNLEDYYFKGRFGGLSKINTVV